MENSTPFESREPSSDQLPPIDWREYENFVRTEKRLRKRKRILIVITISVCLGLFSVPVIRDRGPYWDSMRALAVFAEEISRMKIESLKNHVPMQIRVLEGAELRFVIEQVKSCEDSQGTVIRSDALRPVVEQLTFVSSRSADELQIPSIIEKFCFDPDQGSFLQSKGQDMAAFGVMPVKDLTTHRSDRVSLLILKGNSAEILLD